MSGQRIGYIRVSTLDQHTEQQLDGIEVDKTFTDKVSGKDTNLFGCNSYTDVSFQEPYEAIEALFYIHL
jgi:hypothetical protein